LRREREKYRNIISEKEAIFYKFIDGIYITLIDGRKDVTLLTEHNAQTSKYYHKTEPQEHIVVVGVTWCWLLNACLSTRSKMAEELP